MRKLVLSGICVLASALAFACSSSKTNQNQGAPFDNGSAGATNGNGGAANGGAANGGASSGGAANGGAANGGAANGGTSSGTGGSTASAPYPNGPYGYSIGDTIPNQTFYGWQDPAKVNYTGALTKVNLSDLYDPDGSKGNKLILMDVAARWCTYCQQEEHDIETQGLYTKYRPKGAQFFVVVFEDINQNPSTANDLHLWTMDYRIESPSVIDPGFWFGHFFSADAAPLNMIVDARNMKIMDKLMGYDATTQWNTLDTDLAKIK